MSWTFGSVIANWLPWAARKSDRWLAGDVVRVPAQVPESVQAVPFDVLSLAPVDRVEADNVDRVILTHFDPGVLPVENSWGDDRADCVSGLPVRCGGCSASCSVSTPTAGPMFHPSRLVR
jgi:hypothetical protein